jgi:succinate dehydrogenase / fumarate reductase iron-sulfur subunit
MSAETATQVAAPEGTQMRYLRVFRYKRGDPAPHYDEFEVPVGPDTVLLEALRWIQLNADPTLALRHSCFHASCGTCGMRVNDREVLACVTAVHDLPRRITVEPLANVPVLTDLVVDMTEFYARLPDEFPVLRESEFQAEAEAPEGIAAYMRYEDCIECALCLSACPIAGTSDSYAGPAALAAAARLVEEPRGVGVGHLLRWADRRDGVWRCHAAFECTEACPSNVNPAARIMMLRGSLVGGRLRLAGQEEGR